MLQYDVVREQDRFQAIIGIDEPLSEFAKDFADIGAHRIGFKTACTEHSMKDRYSRGMAVPIIRCEYGQVSFDVAKWRRCTSASQTIEYFRHCTGQSLGYPALIPASFVDIAAYESDNGRQFPGCRLNEQGRGHLYIGSMYWPAEAGQISAVTPLIREAGPDIAPYSEWQPLLIPTHALPISGVLAFLSVHGAGHLRRSSLSGSVNAVPL